MVTLGCEPAAKFTYRHKTRPCEISIRIQGQTDFGAMQQRHQHE